MKKSKYLVVFALICLTLLFAITGCGQTEQSGQTEAPKPEKYTVMFNLNGGTFVSGSMVQTVKKGASATAPVVTNGSRALSWDVQFSDIQNDTIVTAIWGEEQNPEPKKYTVMFNLNGGTFVSGNTVQTVTEGSAAVAPVVKNGSQNLSWDVDFSNIKSDTIVTAIWKKNEYNVTFDLNGGTLVSGNTTQKVFEGESAVAPNVTNGTLKLSWDVDFSKVTSDITVRAVWNRAELSPEEIRELAKNSTVKIVSLDRDEKKMGSGSGFFISEDGKLVTSFHVIKGAKFLRIETDSESSYEVTEIIAFNPAYDIAILKVRQKPKAYLSFCEDESSVRQLDNVYAFGYPLGASGTSITSGIISYEDRFVGKLECFQTTAPISQGNSGGPLVNAYGEVVGINAFSYVNGENMHLAIKPSMLDKIGKEVNYSVSRFVGWYDGEILKSYYILDRNSAEFKPSLINTYQTVTGVKCAYSLTTDKTVEGYAPEMNAYAYAYKTEECAIYEEYLYSQGFDYDQQTSVRGMSVFKNAFTGETITLAIADSEEFIIVYVAN